MNFLEWQLTEDGAPDPNTEHDCEGWYVCDTQDVQESLWCENTEEDIESIPDYKYFCTIPFVKPVNKYKGKIRKAIEREIEKLHEEIADDMGLGQFKSLSKILDRIKEGEFDEHK